MKRLLRIFFIVACLVGVAYSLFHSPCPPSHRIIAQWSEDAADYHAGRISFDELIYRSDRLIECSERLREAYLKERRCNRKTHTVPCQCHRHLHVTVGRWPVPRRA